MKMSKPTEEQRLAVIREIVKAVQSGETIVEVDEDFVNELRAEQATEDLVVEHGLLNAQQEDVEDESQFLDLEKQVDFDDDESETDMENISPSMREAYRGS